MSVPSFSATAPMHVMPWTIFMKHEQLLRSDEAKCQVFEEFEKPISIFISHNWWVKPTKDDDGAPDFVSGLDAHLKFRRQHYSTLQCRPLPQSHSGLATLTQCNLN